MDEQIQHVLQSNGITSAPQSDASSGDPIASILQQNGVTGSSPNQSADDGDLGNQDYNGLCQAYAEQKTLGHSGVYPTAIQAYEDQAQKGNVNSDFSQMKPGDLIYFAPDQSNQDEGHVGIYSGNGMMKSATYNGIQKSDLKSWNQQPLGFIRGYK